MRTFYERKAEIFRLSEEKIKHRKKVRNRVIFSCAPILLCAVLFSFTVLPELMSVKNDSASEDEYYSIAFMYVTAEITDFQNDDYYRKIDNKEDVNEALNMIESFGLFLEEAEDATDAYDSQTKGDAGATQSKKPNATKKEDYVSGTEKNDNYKIVFTDTEGKKAVYTLKGRVLKNKSTNDEIILSDSQLAKLKTTLGIKN